MKDGRHHTLVLTDSWDIVKVDVLTHLGPLHHCYQKDVRFKGVSCPARSRGVLSSKVMWYRRPRGMSSSSCFFSTLNELSNIMNSRELAMKQVSYLSDDLTDFSQKCKSAQAKHSQSSTVPSTHWCIMVRIYSRQFISWEDSCLCRKRERALKQGNDYKKIVLFMMFIWDDCCFRFSAAYSYSYIFLLRWPTCCWSWGLHKTELSRDYLQFFFWKSRRKNNKRSVEEKARHTPPTTENSIVAKPDVKVGWGGVLRLFLKEVKV